MQLINYNITLVIPSEFVFKRRF